MLGAASATSPSGPDRAGCETSRHALERHGVEMHFEDHGICHSLYLRDPDGYQVEITTYEVPAR